MSTTTIAVATLITINATVGILLILGKLRLVVVRKPQLAPQPLQSVAPIEVPKPKRGRPRKFKVKAKPRHLYLPPNTTKQQLGEVHTFFQKHQDKQGDKITLHLSGKDGAERSIELPYLVHWDKDIKEDLSTILGGWS